MFSPESVHNKDHQDSYSTSRLTEAPCSYIEPYRHPLLSDQRFAQTDVLPEGHACEVLRHPHDEKRDWSRIISQLSKTLLRCLKFTGYARNIMSEFSPVKLEPGLFYKELSLSGMLGKAELGGVQFDLTNPPCFRKNVQLLAARALSVVSVIDYFVDETDLEPDRRSVLIRNMLRTIKTGELSGYQHPQLAMTEAVCRKINGEVSKLPNGKVFFGEFSKLAEAAIKQIEGTPSLELAGTIGKHSVGLAACIPYCFNPGINPRFLLAGYHFGAYVQIVDDMTDYDHDKARGLKTSLTCGINTKEAFEKACRRAEMHYGAFSHLLKKEERILYQALCMLGKNRWSLRI